MTELVEGLTEIVGTKHVLVDPAAQQRFLKDFSWYSPVLAEAFIDTRIDAVVQPATIEELEQVVATAVHLRVPIIVRGAGTGNYGQSVPLYGGGERGACVVHSHPTRREANLDQTQRTVLVSRGRRSEAQLAFGPPR